MITFYQKATLYDVETDWYGKPTKVNEREVDCRVKEKYQLVKDKAATEVVSELEITVGADTEFQLDGKVEYPKDVEHSIISFKITRNTIGEVVKKVIYL